MSCRSRHKGVIALLFLLYSFAVQAVDTSNVLIVDLYLNHEHMGDTFVLQGTDGDFLVAEEILLHWQISKPWPAPQTFGGENYYSISQFSGAKASFVLRSMELHVSMPPSLMPVRSVDMNKRGIRARADDYGAYMDYDLSWLSHEATGAKTAYGLFRPVAFGAFGNLSANLAWRDYSGGNVVADEFSQGGLNVLELTYTRDDPSKMRSLRIGDVFTYPGSHGHSLRMGGIQFATNFATQPTFITYPLPSFYGETAVPSALDIYVNGRLKQTRDVEPGRYILEDVPVITGAGQLQVVARDMLGRQQVFTQDFYLSTELLKEGLSDYSFNLGALRENYALENFDYGDLAGTATWRYGLRENLTVEGHGEFSDGIAMLGGAAQYAIESGGIVKAGLGVSTGNTGSGVNWQLGFRQLSSQLSYNLEVSGTTKHFELVGQYASLPKLQLMASGGRSFYDYGGLGISVIHQSFHDKPARTIVSVNHSKSFRNLLSMTTYLSFVEAESSDFSAGIRVSMPFGDKHSVSGGLSGNRSGGRVDAEISRNLPVGTGYGYHLAASAADNSYIDAGVIAQNELGRYSLDVRASGDSGSIWQAGTSGSIAYLSGMTKATRQIRDAFAVVNVGDFEGVRIYSENQEIGQTNKNGQLFVPGLRPYHKNQLRIEIDDLPLNARIGQTRSETAPYYRSGVIINFDVSASNNVMLRAVLPDNSPLPEGAVAKIENAAEEFPIGLDGRVYLQGIDRSSRIEIRWNGRICDLDVPYPDSNAMITRLGDIVCQPRKAQ